VRPCQAGRRVGNAEIAIPGVGAQAIGLEVLLAVMADGDLLLRPPGLERRGGARLGLERLAR